MSNERIADVPVDGLFLDRWSPRAFDPAFELTEASLHPLFEAARWAPSAFNWQPWRFAFALRQEPRWTEFVDLLMPFNAMWAKNASALIFVASETHIKLPMAEALSPSHSHAFDTGAACALLALQARREGLYTHTLNGIHMDRIKTQLGVPSTQRVEAAMAIGKLGDRASLPERLQARETPSGRKPVAEFAVKARFQD
ncbi:nitroreductase family protein [Variovorax terrae]|uniref:Nitroreductase family protein n=1 Tax=Variovorax terrae TaxID=2923278 RepID=A0A9X2ANJ7_9BURK|nr:nitroreductase family protein [Variovorax terrae]MCJ0764913.1 nitroreductase family protein [Variovorax terrae]